jgi:FkbM family methyltransferase
MVTENGTARTRRPTGAIHATPNPIVLERGRAYASCTLTWTATDVDEVEIHVAAPEGPLLARGGASGTAMTGDWVTDWTTFFLQDVSNGRTLTLSNTLSTVCVTVARTMRASDAAEQARSERGRLERLPRYQSTTSTLFARPFEILDAASFLTMYDEIVEQEIYRFDSVRNRPYIIDCGANVGVSLYYFKQLFPDARVVAFEPDPAAFTTLSRNAETFGWTEVKLVNKAVSDRESDVPFVSEGSWGSRLARDADEPTGTVPTTRLRGYINEPVDLLKLDIEGAETSVLVDCADLLDLVDRIVLEFHSFVDEPQALDRVLSVLATAGYRVYVRSISAAWPLQPFVQRPVYSGMDMQLYVYAFRTAPAA